MTVWFSILVQLANAQAAPFQIEFAKGELLTKCKAAIAKADDRYKEIQSLKPEQRTLETTILAADDIEAEFSDSVSPYFLMKNVSTSADTRKEAAECSQLVSQFSNDIGTRRELYVAMKDQKGRNADEKRLVYETIKNFERNGMKLSDDKLKKYRELNDKLDDLQLKFGDNLRNDNTEVLFTPEELAGVRPDYLNDLKKNDKGLLRVPTREPDYVEVMQKAKDPETRKKMLFAYLNRAGEANIKLLEQALPIRQEIAALLGYKTWADYRLEDRMAKTSGAVMSFLNGLRSRLADGNKKDMAELLKFKQEIEPGATAVNQWDTNFLSYQLQSKKFQLDLEKVREYFPADVVVPGMLQVYSEMLGVKFKEIINAKVWAPEVKGYEIHDKKTDKLLGLFYLDLYGRPGKYSHAACANVISGRKLKDGHYNVPVSVIYANLSSPTQGKPSLLTYADRGEVVTLFHEFGHAMHGTLTRAPFASLSGTNVKRDFVEAPSQMLENWVYRPEILERLSGHYTDHSKKLPADMLKTLIELRDFQQARIYTRQLLLGTYDMTINLKNGAIDTLKTYDTLYKEITGQEQMPGVKFPASFGHLMGGYDAGYYGYLWSKVYAEDMFTIFAKAGLTSPSAGARYRTEILERGNMEEPLSLVKKFLGREPNNKAFLKSIGLK